MRVGVLLGGCGLYDGSDVHETVLTLLALEIAGEKPVLVAPDVEQDRTVDHLTGEAAAGESRSVLREAARLARGSIQDLASCRPQDLEALIIPGGYGPVVNFSTGFARQGEAHALRPDVERFIRHFLEERKPVGTVSLGEVPVRMILGLPLDPTPAGRPGDIVVEAGGRSVHTPGFAGFTRLGDVRAGIEAMVAEVLERMEARARGPSAPGPEGGR